jgi:tripeptidyl-peptidase-1
LVDTRIGALFTQAYPDVSAQSQSFLIFYQGQGALISGTSASAPTFAAIVALLNDAMLAADRPPLGFLNPLLYSKGAAGFNDITSGNAPGCGTPGFNVRLPSPFHDRFFLFLPFFSNGG